MTGTRLRITECTGNVVYDSGAPGYTAPIIAHCPDLLRYEQIGEADNLRGRVVRGFFWLMRLWPV